MCEHGKGHVISHRSACIDSFLRVPVCWNIHLLLTQLSRLYEGGSETPIGELWMLGFSKEGTSLM